MTSVPNRSILTPVNHFKKNRLSKAFFQGHARPRLQQLKTSRLSRLLTFPPRTSSSGLSLSEASVQPVRLEYTSFSQAATARASTSHKHLTLRLALRLGPFGFTFKAAFKTANEQPACWTDVNVSKCSQTLPPGGELLQRYRRREAAVDVSALLLLLLRLLVARGRKERM